MLLPSNTNSKQFKIRKIRWLRPVSPSKYVKTLQLEGCYQVIQTQNSSKIVKFDGWYQLVLQNTSKPCKKQAQNSSKSARLDGWDQLMLQNAWAFRKIRLLIPINTNQKDINISEIEGWYQVMAQSMSKALKIDGWCPWAKVATISTQNWV